MDGDGWQYACDEETKAPPSLRRAARKAVDKSAAKASLRAAR